MPYFGHSLLKFYCYKGPGKCGSIYWKGKKGYDIFRAHYLEIHSPAEHTIDMVRFPMELQVYHCNGECNTKSEYVVISVLFSVGNSSSSQEIDKLWGPGTTSFEDASRFKQKKYKKKRKYKYMNHTKKKVDMSNLYDLNAGFFHYDGSFTTPPCVENVQFLVQSGPAKITMENLLAVQKQIGYPGNARPQQALYTRKVKYFSRQSMSPSLPYRVQSTDVTSAPFKAYPPEWARKEHCKKYNKEESTPAGENKFYDCSQT